MTPNAVRRTARSGSHLTLVTTDITEPAVDESEQPRGKHAAPAYPLPIAGSATVRALMALGAVLSAVGLSIGRADAALHHQAQEKPAEAQADTTPDVTDTPVMHTVVAAAPAAPIVAVAARTRTSPGHWDPVNKPVVTRTYMAAPVQGTGKHRRQPTVEHTGNLTTRATGRHRRTTTQGHVNTPQTRGNLLPTVVIQLPVSHVI